MQLQAGSRHSILSGKQFFRKRLWFHTVQHMHRLQFDGPTGNCWQQCSRDYAFENQQVCHGLSVHACCYVVARRVIGARCRWTYLPEAGTDVVHSTRAVTDVLKAHFEATMAVLRAKGNSLNAEAKLFWKTAFH